MSEPPIKQNEDEAQADIVEEETSLDARARLGQRLSQARQSRDMGLNEACERLRIRKTYLEALESGDWSALPEEVYAIGFLRQYAALLDLDVSQEIEALKSGEYRLTRPFMMPDPPIAMGRTWALAAAACFLILLILFNVVDNGNKRKPSQTPIVAPKEKANQVPAGAVPATGNAPAIPAQTPSAAQQTQTEPAATTATPATPAATNTPENGKTVKQAASGEHVYQLKAVGEDVWLQLYDPKGTLLKEVLLHSGQSTEISSAADYLLLTSGNPQHLSLSIDGVQVAAAGALGEKGKVLHDYRFKLPAVPAASGH